jgi:glycosyltransferase involved in cell wall biosynthesis
MVDQPVRDASWPLVSVVIPALNEARNLPSVLGRMPPEIHEVILADGCYVDGTVTVAREAWPRLRVVAPDRFGEMVSKSRHSFRFAWLERTSLSQRYLAWGTREYTKSIIRMPSLTVSLSFAR